MLKSNYNIQGDGHRTACFQNIGLELETKAAGGLRQFHYNTDLHHHENLKFITQQ
jgi:hypothetical protein